MLLLAVQTTVLGVALLWFLFSGFQNGEFATLSAAIPDHVPVRQRATVSGWVGMPIALGLVLGSILVVDILNQAVTTSYIVLAVLMVVLALPFVLLPAARIGDRVVLAQLRLWRWWLQVTRKAIAASYLTHHGWLGPRHDDQTRLIHASCQRELQARQRRKPEQQPRPATPLRLA
jgi:MFS family permease